MLKIITTESLSFDQPTTQLVKLARDGMRSNDLRLFKKRGSSDGLLAQLPSMRQKVASGEELIHVYAMGSTEATGPNRNGDGFRRDVLRTYHPTFVKHAHWYRNHANTDPHKSYGRLVGSAFNEDMQRAELLVALFSNKTAADRYEALVADREMHKLASGSDIPVSMACSVAYDVCSYCGKQSAKPSDYCTKSMCKAGGLRQNMGSVIDIDGGLHHLHADNPHPCFFDISHIDGGRQADRIAYVTGRIKSATTGVVKSAELAIEMQLQAPLDVRMAGVSDKVAIQQLQNLNQLAKTEQAAGTGKFAVPRGYTESFNSAITDSKRVRTPQITQTKLASFMRATADAKVLLPIADFLATLLNEPVIKVADAAEAVKPYLPLSFTRLLQSPDCERKLASNPFIAGNTSDELSRNWAQSLVEAFGLSKSAVQRRMQLAAIHTTPAVTLLGGSQSSSHGIKTAADAIPFTDLAEQYCLYKIAFLQAQTATDDELALTCTLAVMQNYVT